MTEQEAMLAAILYKVEGNGGKVLVGDSTVEWVRKHVTVELVRDGSATWIHWRGPSVKFEGT